MESRVEYLDLIKKVKYTQHPENKRIILPESYKIVEVSGGIGDVISFLSGIKQIEHLIPDSVYILIVGKNEQDNLDLCRSFDSSVKLINYRECVKLGVTPWRDEKVTAFKSSTPEQRNHGKISFIQLMVNAFTSTIGIPPQKIRPAGYPWNFQRTYVPLFKDIKIPKIAFSGRVCAGNFREWIMEYYQKLIDSTRGRFQFVQVGRKVEPNNDSKLFYMDCIDATVDSIDETAWVLSQCDLFLTTVNGLKFLSSCVGTSNLVLYGNENEYCTLLETEDFIASNLTCRPCWSSPFLGCDKQCMQEITVSMVIAKLEALLDEQKEYSEV